MNKWTYLMGTGLVAFSLNTFAADEAEMGTVEEAQAMSEKAAELVNEKGNDAFDVFADKEGDFQDKDLYVFCMDLEGLMLSHAVKPDLVGKNLIEFNTYGDKLFEDMIGVAKSEEGKGWVKYNWPYPGTEDLKAKESYVITNEKGFFCGVGAYAAAAAE